MQSDVENEFQLSALDGMRFHGIAWDWIEVTGARYLGKSNFLNATAVALLPGIQVRSQSCK
jgi:hypothetical protein